VLLGAHDLSDIYEVGRTSAAVKEIFIHPDWNPNAISYDADIAIVKLEADISFSPYIQPICLITSSAEVVKITEGVVVGYGKSETPKFHEKIPKSINSPIIYHRNCSEKFDDLTPLLSHRAFCGGNADGTGTCAGDSGNGLFVESGGIFYLRGIVSASLLDRNNECNTNKLSIFVDVLQFNFWIITETSNIETLSIEKFNTILHEITQTLPDDNLNEVLNTIQKILRQRKNNAK